MNPDLGTNGKSDRSRSKGHLLAFLGAVIPALIAAIGAVWVAVINRPGPSSVTPSATSPPPKSVTSVSLSITSPSNGADADRCTQVVGTAPRVYPAGRLWLVVHALDWNKYYPNEPLDPAGNGTWSQKVTLGGVPPGDNGARFEIIILAADVQAEHRFRTVADSATGIDLPSGVTDTGVSVSVTRKAQSHPSPGCN